VLARTDDDVFVTLYDGRAKRAFALRSRPSKSPIVFLSRGFEESERCEFEATASAKGCLFPVDRLAVAPPGADMSFDFPEVRAALQAAEQTMGPMKDRMDLYKRPSFGRIVLEALIHPEDERPPILRFLAPPRLRAAPTTYCPPTCTGGQAWAVTP
jgi:hypothetical protein